MEDKLKQLEEHLWQLNDNYFKEYTSLEVKDADYYLALGKCSGIGEAIDLLEEVLDSKKR